MNDLIWWKNTFKESISNVWNKVKLKIYDCNSSQTRTPFLVNSNGLSNNLHT